MSLLNDMLRDLSHQQHPADTMASTPQAALDFNAQEQRELFYHTSAAKPLPRTLVPSLVVFVVVLAIMALWKFDFFMQPAADISASEPLAIDITTETQSDITPTDIKSTSVEVSTIAPTVVEAEKETETMLPELGERIAALESAITNLSTVVASANNHVVNSQMLDQSVLAQTSYPQADEPLPAAEKIPEQATVSVSIQEPFVQPVAESVADTSEPQLTIAPNTKWQDQQQAQQANQLVVQGQSDIAITKLQQFIATAAQPRESVKTLLDIFAVQENVTAMEALLAQANYLSVVEQQFYAAKIAVIQQQDARAIELLEIHLGEAEQNENYRALLAGLYQRTGMNLEAANHYRRLLSVFGDKPAYWLGFALAQDALNQQQVAAQAYQRVNQYADLQPQVRTYVQQRIAALQQ